MGMNDRTMGERSFGWGLRLSRGGFALAVAGALVAAAAGPSYRFGLLPLEPAIAMLAVGAGIGIVASLFCVVGANMLRRPGQFRFYALGWFGVLVGAGTFMAVYTLYQQTQSAPPIHDITTDPSNPPTFVALLPERLKSPNGVAYDAEHNVPLQLQAYADLNRITVTDRDPKQVFAAALAVARDQGWHIAAADADAGRIEATTTSFWWGFKDDVAVRVARTSEGNVRVDIRSASRVGEGDLGANAERVRKYLAALRVRLGQQAEK
jgi:uncharacterized protein (DUF1499 family)